MPNYTVTSNIDTLLKSTTNAAARTNLGLGDAATKNTGTTAGTVAAGDDSRITGAVQTTRTITAGTGLTGGGDLSANRTLAVSYGTTAGTAAQGNDARLSDARTPTAHAASHAAAGSDPITITATQISGSLTQNTTGTASNVTGTVAIANGGTGQTTANAALNALLPTQTGNNGKVLSTDGTSTSWTTAGGSGTVTSITAGTGLTGGTITTSGTVAADFGTTTGKVTEGGTTVLKGGDTMTGKLTLPAATTAAAPINIGSSGVQPVTPVTGDVWIRNNLIQYKGSSATVNSVAATAEPNSFSARQTIQVADNSNPALRVTQLGTGEALRVEDEANPDATAFVVSASGRVGVGVAPDAAVALSVDTTGIKFGDGTIQTTAGGAGGVSSFSAGTTGLTPATSTTGAVTLAGTLAIANGGTGQTTAANAINALVPAQAGQSGKVLTTNGSVVSWGTAGAGGITALTGDVSASGSGSVSSTIIALRGRAVASTAPTTGQVLGWNGSQWEPTSAGGSVSYDILKVLFTGPTSGTYNVPSGYKYADIYAAGGGGGGGAGAYVNAQFAVSGGGGGACGVFGRREKVYVENAFITYDIGAGGAGGYMDVNGNATNGLAGQGTLVLLQAGGPQFPILDCGFYINQQTATGGQGGSTLSSGGGSLSFFDIWVQDAQTGGGGLTGGPGQPPTNNTIYSSNVYVSAGAGGGGVDASLTLYDGGNINDRNYILYSSGSAIQYKGTAGSSASIDATSPMSISPIHFGGAGGAAANTSTAIYNGTFYRAGNGANGQPGCGGGGGGCMYDDIGAGPGSYAGGNGGNGGPGFLLMYLYK